MKNILYILFFYFPVFMISQHYIEIDFGYHNPQGYFDKYNDSGFSFRGTYSKIDPIKTHLRYDFSFQFLQFKSDSWSDNSLGYPATITNSEQSVGFFFGPRLMSSTRRGILRPYIGIKGGFIVFSETMSWEWQDYNNSSDLDWLCILFEILDDDDDWDCNNNPNEASRTLDSKFNFGAIFEIGANIKVDNSWGFDFGVQYNLIPALKRSDEFNYNIDEDILYIDQISKTINADYVTFYTGFHFNLNNNKKGKD